MTLQSWLGRVRNASSFLVFYAFRWFPFLLFCPKREREILSQPSFPSIYQRSDSSSSSSSSTSLENSSLFNLAHFQDQVTTLAHLCLVPLPGRSGISHAGITSMVCVYISLALWEEMSVSKNGKMPVPALTSWQAGRLFPSFLLLSLAPTLGLMSLWEIAGFLRLIVLIPKLGCIFTL